MVFYFVMICNLEQRSKLYMLVQKLFKGEKIVLIFVNVRCIFYILFTCGARTFDAGVLFRLTWRASLCASLRNIACYIN